MKILLRTGIICFSILSLWAFFISLYKAEQLYVQPNRTRIPPRNYHFLLYLPDNRNSFFTGIIRGAERAAEELNAAVSVHSIDPAKHELEMASYTGADGALVCPYLDDGLARRQLEKLGVRQIPVVIINHNIPNDQPWPFIGTNNFEVGRKIGTLAGAYSGAASSAGANNGGAKGSDVSHVSGMPGLPLRMALVYSDKAPGIYGERELVEMGITAVLGNRLTAPIMGFRTNLNPLDAEALLYRLFHTNPDINTVVFTDSNDTIAAAQTLIDMNLVGRVQVIGFGADPLIRDSIRKGIISGSIVIDPERIGYEAVCSLAALRTTGYTSTSIDTGVEVLTQNNLP